jgi:hypothetical protein
MDGPQQRLNSRLHRVSLHSAINYVAIDRAEDAVHRLRIDVHYCSVEARRKAADTDPPKSLTD